MCVYNAEATVARAVESVLAQADKEVELIVVNDGSTDSTSSVLDDYHGRITLIDQANRGIPFARNRAIGGAQGRYLAFADADDMWLPGRLAETCAALDEHPDSVLAFGDLMMTDDGERLRPWVVGRPPSQADLLTRGWGIYPSAMTTRRSVYEACGAS